MYCREVCRMAEYDNSKTNRVVTLLDQKELEILKYMANDSGLSTSSYLRLLILQNYSEEYVNKDS